MLSATERPALLPPGSAEAIDWTADPARVRWPVCPHFAGPHVVVHYDLSKTGRQ